MIEVLSLLISYDMSNRTTNLKTQAEPSLWSSGRCSLFFSSTALFTIPEGYHYILFIFNEGLRRMKLKISDY